MALGGVWRQEYVHARSSRRKAFRRIVRVWSLLQINHTQALELENCFIAELGHIPSLYKMSGERINEHRQTIVITWNDRLVFRLDND